MTGGFERYSDENHGKEPAISKKKQNTCSISYSCEGRRDFNGRTVEIWKGYESLASGSIVVVCCFKHNIGVPSE